MVITKQHTKYIDPKNWFFESSSPQYTHYSYRGLLKYRLGRGVPLGVPIDLRTERFQNGKDGWPRPVREEDPLNEMTRTACRGRSGKMSNTVWNFKTKLQKMWGDCPGHVSVYPYLACHLKVVSGIMELVACDYLLANAVEGMLRHMRAVINLGTFIYI